MIDDATIKLVYGEMRSFDFDVSPDSLLKFASAIEQLARQAQREEDARICEKLSPTVSYKTNAIPLEERGYRSGVIECAEAIRTAAEIGNEIEQSKKCGMPYIATCVFDNETTVLRGVIPDCSFQEEK